MKVHHINGAIMTPPVVGRIVAHVLLVEHPTGLVLVDAGFGRADQADRSRIGPMRALLRPSHEDADTAAAAVERLGHRPEDVTDVVLTHLDLDHAGGIADFPGARVHTTAAEHRAALPRPRGRDALRYRPAQLLHDARWEIHQGPGDPWSEPASGVRLSGIEVLPGITMLPTHGHTRGHTAVAVQSDRGLLVHAGDAVFDGSVLTDVDPAGRRMRPLRVLRAFEQVIAHDRSRIAGNHAALRHLHTSGEAVVIPAHDPRVYEALRATG